MSRTAAILALVAVSLAAACDKVALLAPTDSVITLSVNTTTIPINGTAEVIATVIEPAGTPVHNGTVVTFTSTVGVVEPREAQTQGGLARAVFRANGQSGTAIISAFSGGARVDEPLEILVGGAAAETVSVRTEPTAVPATGGTVTVIAIVTDASGNGLPGAPVVFSADNGTLSSNSAVTDANGEARVTLLTNRQTVVRAQVASKSGTATISVVTLPSITLTASPAAPAVGVPVTFTITPGSATTGNPVTNVTFDPGDGTGPRNLGPQTGATTFSYLYTSEGSFTAVATATDSAGFRGQSSIALVVQRAIPTVSISATNTNPPINTPVTFNINSAAGTLAGGGSGPPVRFVDVSFSDGQASAQVGPGPQSVTRQFSTPGTYTARARAVDAAGSTAETSTTIVVRAGTGFP